MPDGAVGMALSVYGKHPAKGDFVEYGLADGLKPVVEGWLDAVLAEIELLGLPQPLYLMCHSMGGCIGLRSLMRGVPVRAAVTA